MAEERWENGMGDEKNFGDNLKDQIHRDIHERINNTIDEKMRRHRFSVGVHFRGRNVWGFGGGALWGAIILVVGVAFLLDNLGILPIDRIFRLWPIFLIGAGIVNVTRCERRVWGVVLILVGSLFLLDSFGIAHFRWAQLWPLALIVAGLLVMWNSLEARRASVNTDSNSTTTAGAVSGTGARNTLNELAFFGGIERRITTQNFEGGQAMAIFGGVEIDLRQASMEAEEAVLEVNSIFGGCEIRVPETWTIITEGQGIFGGYVDNTRQTGVPDIANPKKKTLLIRGAAVFGGVEIKN